jgi:abequosyltransferase
MKLSVCIPTYNRGEFIEETIKSVLDQVTDEVEIVISDNGSNDKTEEIIRTYQEIFPRIRYFRWENNVGADRNFLKVIEIAEGEYCWFMSSDDRVEPGAVSHILSQLKRHPGITGLSVNQAIYSPDMRTVISGVQIAGGELNSDRYFSDMDECFSYLGLYFGYLPGQVVNRALWDKIVASENLVPYFNAFVHIYVIGLMLMVKPSWKYVQKECVGYRSGNDSFLQEGGIYTRQVIAHSSFEKIIRDLLGRNSRTYRSILSMGMTGYMRSDLVRFKINGTPAFIQMKLFCLYTKFYWRYSYYWLKVVPLFFIPNRFVVPLRNMYRKSRGGNA